jgi:hypothetical protein
MFEKFSEPARRALFWARLEAGRTGAGEIELEHLLAGWLVEDQGDWAQMAASHFGEEKPRSVPNPDFPPSRFVSSERAKAIRQVLVEWTITGVPKPHAADMPMGERAQRALVAANQHAGDSTVGLLHLLWGLLSDESSSISILMKSNGITAEQVDHAIRGGQYG